MGSDPNQYLQEKQQRTRDQQAQQMKARSTLEVVGLERQEAGLPAWQQRIINILALLGGPAIIYVIVDVLFS